MRKIVLGLSGGMDSATLIGLYLSQGFEVHACSFIYGSKHGKYENKAAEEIVTFYHDEGFPVFWRNFDLKQPFLNFKSNLLLTGGPIPEGHYEAPSMAQTVVPGRNMIFASIMAGYAESIGAEAIALGVHAGDHAIYPDCRPDFIEALRNTIEISTEGKVDVWTPLLYEDKARILKIGLALTPPVPYHLTRTCYKDQELSCGVCGSDVERLTAFSQIGIEDPIQYENRNFYKQFLTK